MLLLANVLNHHQQQKYQKGKESFAAQSINKSLQKHQIAHAGRIPQRNTEIVNRDKTTGKVLTASYCSKLLDSIALYKQCLLKSGCNYFLLPEPWEGGENLTVILLLQNQSHNIFFAPKCMTRNSKTLEQIHSGTVFLSFTLLVFLGQLQITRTERGNYMQHRLWPAIHWSKLWQLLF